MMTIAVVMVIIGLSGTIDAIISRIKSKNKTYNRNDDTEPMG